MNEISKSQGIRLADVIFIGPFLIWAARKEKLSPRAKAVMAVIGVLTIGYNLKNYLLNKLDGKGY